MTKGPNDYAPEWPKCSVCGLKAPDVAVLGPLPPRCPSGRCERVPRGESLGGKSWGPAEAWMPAGDDPPRVPFTLAPPTHRNGHTSWEEEQWLFAQPPAAT